MELQNKQEEKKGFQESVVTPSIKDRRLIIAIIVLILIIIVLITILIIVAVRNDCSCKNSSFIKRNSKTTLCKNDKIVINPNMKDEKDIFRELSLQELHSIEKYMSNHYNLNPLGLIDYRNDTYIQNIELYIPDKINTLRFLDEGGPTPERRARVTIIQAPYNITYFIVGPLPKPTYYELAKFNDRDNPLPFSTYSFDRVPKMKEIATSLAKEMWELFKETYDLLKDYKTSEDAIANGLHGWSADANVVKEGELTRDMVWIWNGKKEKNRGHLNILSTIAVNVNCTSDNQSDWSIGYVIYNFQIYKNIETIMNLYKNGKLKIVKIKDISKSDFSKASLKRRGSQNGYFPSSEPLTISPHGPRFSIKGKKITYLDWQFNYMVHPSSGPAMFDVRFKHQRIAFEISLQEASSLYSTGEPYLKSNDILDSTWFLGVSTSLIKGVDCPQSATFLDVTLYMNTKANIVKDAICVFEQNPSVPFRRHHHKGANGSYRYGGLADASLVIRYITDMYYYDYIHDFVFHQNGALEVRTTTTGHLLLSPYYSQNDTKYGYEVKNNFLGGIHDHFMLYKVDLDILGTKNSFQTIDISVKKFADPWDPHSTFKKFLTYNKRKSESDATVKYDFDKPKYYIIYNENEKNKYGNTRGYRILSHGNVKQVYPDEHTGTKATEWSKYQISVSKYKDTERYGSCMFNFYPPYEKSRCSFDARIKDDENIENEDLVAWIPIGGLHIPSTEDYPTTPTVGNQFTFFIKPFNYFDEDPSFSSANSVYIEKTDESTIIETYDTPEEATCKMPKRIIG